MSALVELFSGPAWRQILLTLAHSLWQGALLALLLAAVLTRIAGNRPSARYWASLLSLAALVGASMVTWSVLDLPAEHSRGSETAAIPSAAIPSSTAAAEVRGLETSPPYANIPPLTHANAWTGFVAQAWTVAAAVCTALWLLGVVLMLVRMVWLITGVRRLAAQPLLADHCVLELVAGLRRRLGIVRSIRVVDSSAIGPAVLGIVRPVLLLPAALVSELPPECLEAILAHELAHICRHDYLVNLLQMLVEAALFFNPAVWWINRQIRREREACCDATAVSLTGQPLTYAEALAAWLECAQASRFTQALPAWHGNGERGTLLDRVRRLLVTGYQPELRGSWSALAIGLTGSLLVLSALWTGTRAGVALAAEILSPKQRIEQLAKERDELRPLADGDDKETQVTISGTLRTSDDQPLPATLHANVHIHDDRFTLDSTEGLETPHFSFKTRFGTTLFGASAPGYAPVFVGPFQTKPGEDHKDVEVVFQRGFQSLIQVVDEDGKPVADATVKARPTLGNCGSWPQWKTDSAGLVTADHLASLGYTVDVAAAGFQSLQVTSHEFSRDEPSRLTLIRAKPTSGIVVSPAGEPIAGATICRLVFYRDGHSFQDVYGHVVATTDAAGQFVINDLNDGGKYALSVTAPAGGKSVFSDIRAGDTNLRWVVGPGWTLTGRILGDMSKLANRKGLPSVDYWQSAKILSARSDCLSNEGSAAATVVDGQGRFAIKNLLPGKLVITAAGRSVRYDIAEPSTDVTIDLDQTPASVHASAPRRRVVLRFVGTDPQLAPQGKISLYMVARGSAPSDDRTPGLSQQSDVTIQDGIAEFEAFAPGYVIYDAKNIVGSWFQRGMVEVLAGDKPLEQNVAVFPAGAIRGRVVNADGTPATNVQVNAGSIEKPPGIRRGSPIAINNVPVDATGEFFISPLPLGGIYSVRAMRGHEQAFGAPVAVDSNHPSPTVKIQFSPTATARGRVVDVAGKPVAELPVSLEIRRASGGTVFSPGNETDRDGRFEIKDLSTDGGKYWVKIAPARDYQPLEFPLELGHDMADVRIERGHIIEGRALDAETGKPVPGIEVHAHPIPWSLPAPYRYEPEQPETDAEGRFRFSTLPEGAYGIFTIVIGVPIASEAPENTYQTDDIVELYVPQPKPQ